MPVEGVTGASAAGRNEQVRDNRRYQQTEENRETENREETKNEKNNSTQGQGDFDIRA